MNMLLLYNLEKLYRSEKIKLNDTLILKDHKRIEGAYSKEKGYECLSKEFFSIDEILENTGLDPFSFSFHFHNNKTAFRLDISYLKETKIKEFSRIFENSSTELNSQKSKIIQSRDNVFSIMFEDIKVISFAFTEKSPKNGPILRKLDQLLTFQKLRSCDNLLDKNIIYTV